MLWNTRYQTTQPYFIISYLSFCLFGFQILLKAASWFWVWLWQQCSDRRKQVIAPHYFFVCSLFCVCVVILYFCWIHILSGLCFSIIAKQFQMSGPRLGFELTSFFWRLSCKRNWMWIYCCPFEAYVFQVRTVISQLSKFSTADVQDGMRCGLKALR